ncbi:Type II secretion system (T2SS), protein M subtype b [Pseudovibrio denitrificans]|uniref:Type II secretion system (T2SS), protein M subtype b n=1 Tax=Pseudovibrio denitrificans TaxID=258256 RepID=A0A1I7DZY2_9HYPH|nr:type II secretion system protein GspM [Pseudovibrio denitrificans]SFU17228.1 Type II secretion system (T2SS), protein M subtype b [Pseudovibrio denitrificans]
MKALKQRPHLSRVLAVTLLLSFAFATIIVGIVPLQKELSEKQDQILRLRDQIGRFESAVSEGNTPHQTYSPQQPEVWSGRSNAIIAAQLQEILQRSASINNIAIASILPISGKVIDGFETIGLRLEGDGEIGAVRDFLSSLEVHRPYIFLSAVELRPKPTYGYQNPNELLPLTVRIDLYIASESEEPNNA